MDEAMKLNGTELCMKKEIYLSIFDILYLILVNPGIIFDK